MTNILNFEKDYPEAKVVKLEQNYRSTKNIIWAANNLIANNKNARKKTLFTDNTEGEKIKFINAFDDRKEAQVIADIIKERGGDYSDNLILYRTNSQSRSIEEAMMKNAIPYQVIWGMKFYDRAEIKDILAYLRIIKNPSDIVSLKRIINVPARKIWPTSQATVFDYAYNFEIDPIQVIENVWEIDEIKPAAKNAINYFFQIYSYLTNVSKEISVADLIAEVVKKIDYEGHIKAKSWSKEEETSKKENIDELINVASQFNGMDPMESLTQFLEEVALISDLDNKEEDVQKVTLMTVHTSKWLEAPRVFIAGLEENLFPHQRSISAWEMSKELEEERRLMYVAITRAKEELYISKADERFSFWNYIRNKPSRFIEEIPEEFTEVYEIPNSWGWSWFFSTVWIWYSWPRPSWWLVNEPSSWRRVTSMPKTTNDVSSFVVWTRVEHPKFGVWVIVWIRWDLWDISFGSHWTKKMSLKVAPIKKVW